MYGMGVTVPVKLGLAKQSQIWLDGGSSLATAIGEGGISS